MNKAALNDPRLPQCFWDKVSPEPNSGCWLWTAAMHRNGYGKIGYLGRTRTTHRLAYEELIGPIPDKLQLDHLCRVRCCVNPNHMEPVTAQTNILRGNCPKIVAQRNLSKTHCVRGHEFTAANTRRYGTSRNCRLCACIHTKKYRQKGNA